MSARLFQFALHGGGVVSDPANVRLGVISDVLSARLVLPLCSRFQTYCCLAANDVQGHYRKSAASIR
jgi:hypothetical protein